MPVPSTFQDLILKLTEYWTAQGCVFLQPYDLEVGAGTMNPSTFLRVLGPEPWNCVYVAPSRRPSDSRFGENPNRLHQHHQLQVILKPAPGDPPMDVQEVYLGSLAAIGLTARDHDLRFVEDDWESPTLNAWGLGWEVWCDGMEVTQFTYFQQVGGYDIKPVAAELTYGLERIAMYLQQKDNVFDVVYARRPDGTPISYGEVWKQAEFEFSHYSFHASEPKTLFALFDTYESECKRLLAGGSGGQVPLSGAWPVLALPAFDQCLKCSHTFNLLDARGAISVTERARFLGRVRALAKGCADAYLQTRARLVFPLLKDRARADREAAQLLTTKAA